MMKSFPRNEQDLCPSWVRDKECNTDSGGHLFTPYLSCPRGVFSLIHAQTIARFPF